jgi:hypothetical protein
MSFSFSVATGSAADFADRAAQAKAALETSSEGNDYALTQLASTTADLAIKAASDVVSALAGDDPGATASASISGHHADDHSARTVSVSVNVTPAPAS